MTPPRLRTRLTLWFSASILLIMNGLVELRLGGVLGLDLGHQRGDVFTHRCLLGKAVPGGWNERTALPSAVRAAMWEPRCLPLVAAPEIERAVQAEGRELCAT